MQEAATEDESGLGRKVLNRIVSRFLALHERRLARIRATLTHEQRSLFDLLPLLWHVNHPMLPGFVSRDVPAGMVNYRPSREHQLLARRYVRGFKDERNLHRNAPIVGLYLMGSMGSLGQTAGSDLDFWLCHNDDVDEAGRDLLRRKAARLEERATELGLHAHFFVMHAESFRDGAVEELSKESSGNTQHTLLLEEFYRTGLRLAGNPLLWWAVPPQHEHDYSDYTRRLIKRRFVRADQWLDFGGLHSLPADEFFGVAHWQLFKGIDAPYKSLLKLMLLEAYASEYPKIDWLCLETKRAVYTGEDIDPDDIDPYLLILDRITSYLTDRNEPERLQLARRAFYFKAGQILATSSQSNDWRYQLMLRQCERWGWSKDDIALLDTRPEWKLDRVIGERNALVSELSRSYRLLTEFAREQGAFAHLNPHELALLGRKLYAALDKRPGKVDRVNPGISRDLSERTLWLRRSTDEPARWQLFLHPPEQLPPTPAKTSISLVEILTWLHVNGICERSTQIHHLPKPPGYGEPEQDKILKTLRKYLPREAGAESSLDAYAEMARGRRSIWFINVAENPLASHAQAGYQLISERVDALSFGATHECLVANIEHLYTTSWGEIRIERHSDCEQGLLDCICRYLDLFAPHDHRPSAIAAFSFSSTRGSAIANRITRLVTAIADTFHRLGKRARFVLRIGDTFCQVHYADDHYAWAPVGDQDDLDRHLAETITRYVPTRIDRMGLPDSPLPALMTRNVEGQIQVFYIVGEQGIRLFVFDECGALFQQWVPNADEYHLMVQQRRFLDTVAVQQLLAESGVEHGPQFARIGRLDSGEWQITPVRVPSTRVIERTELTLAVSPGRRLEDGFRLQFGTHEFDSLVLGEALYAEVAAHLRRLRRGGTNYPVYLTGVVGAEGEVGSPCRLMDLLRLKTQVEQRLAAAMR
ncbi:MAG: class I adenylate cyclase [Gammaproteobacteria bacterium]|nr:class I adenylate cyclase [Gammaproteobacteria bacterium]